MRRFLQLLSVYPNYRLRYQRTELSVDGPMVSLRDELNQRATYLLGSINSPSTKRDDSVLKRVQGDSFKIISAEIYTSNLVCF